jgi:hypothetical protein
MHKVILVMCLLLLAGCSKPPVMEKTRATEAIQSSRVKGERLTEAKRLFAAASALENENNKKFALFRSYMKARQFYELSYAALATDANSVPLDTFVTYPPYKFCPHCGAQLY